MPNANAPARLRTRVGRAAIFASGLAVASYLLAVAQVPCGFASIFHVPCPGCGSTRAMLALGSGDFHALVRFNPLAPFMTLLIGALAAQALASILATGSFRRVGDGTVGMIVARGVMVVGALEILVWLARFGGVLGGPVPV